MGGGVVVESSDVMSAWGGSVAGASCAQIAGAGARQPGGGGPRSALGGGKIGGLPVQLWWEIAAFFDFDGVGGEALRSLQDF